MVVGGVIAAMQLLEQVIAGAGDAGATAAQFDHLAVGLGHEPVGCIQVVPPGVEEESRQMIHPDPSLPGEPDGAYG